MFDSKKDSKVPKISYDTDINKNSGIFQFQWIEEIKMRALSS